MTTSFKRQQVRGSISMRAAVAAAVVLLLLAVPSSGLAQSGGAGDHWVATWTMVPVARPVEGRGPQGQAAPAARAQSPRPPLPPAALAPQPILPLKNQTLRQIVRVSLGGERIRVVLSNVYGTDPLVIGAARVALREMDSAIVPKSDGALTFSGRPTMTIPPGAIAVSDLVALTVAPLAELAIDVYVPGDLGTTTSPLTVHAGTGGLQTNYVSLTGDYTGAAEFPVMTTTLSWYFLGRVEVMAEPDVGAVVLFGDSITDGSRSMPNTNNRWPDHLARRLAAQNMRMGVLNAGFSGNRVLSDGNSASGLARFDRDVLAQPGVTHVIVMLGINDIGSARSNPSPSADDIIFGHKQFVTRARAQGLKIYAATLTPFEGAAYWTPEGEAKRGAVNDWIRTNKEYDGVIDFDAALRDPKRPTKFLPRYNSSGDNLHPGDAGYRAMADAVDLALLKSAPRTSRATR